MSLVTLSATYGAGGSEVGPALAQRLGVPFVDRLIPSEVAARLAVGLAAARSHDERSSGVLPRLLLSLAPMAQAIGAEAPAAPLSPIGTSARRPSKSSSSWLKAGRPSSSVALVQSSCVMTRGPCMFGWTAPLRRA